MTITVDLDFDTADALVAQVLRRSIETLESEVETLESADSLKHYQIQDLLDSTVYLEALKITFNYFTPHDQHYDV